MRTQPQDMERFERVAQGIVDNLTAYGIARLELPDAPSWEVKRRGVIIANFIERHDRLLSKRVSQLWDTRRHTPRH